MAMALTPWKEPRCAALLPSTAKSRPKAAVEEQISGVYPARGDLACTLERNVAGIDDASILVAGIGFEVRHAGIGIARKQSALNRCGRVVDGVGVEFENIPG